MSKLLIYIGKDQAFDPEDAVQAILRLDGIENAHRGKFIGAVFECTYAFNGQSTIIRLSEDLETVTAEGLGPESMEFAVKFQKSLRKPLRVIDMDYSFDLALEDYSTGADLMAAVG